MRNYTFYLLLDSAHANIRKRGDLFVLFGCVGRGFRFVRSLRGAGSAIRCQWWTQCWATRTVAGWIRARGFLFLQSHRRNSIAESCVHLPRIICYLRFVSYEIHFRLRWWSGCWRRYDQFWRIFRFLHEHIHESLLLVQRLHGDLRNGGHWRGGCLDEYDFVVLLRRCYRVRSPGSHRKDSRMRKMFEKSRAAEMP